MPKTDIEVKCQNCSWKGKASECRPLSPESIPQRVAPGEPMPYGECPKCFAVCHPVKHGHPRLKTEKRDRPYTVIGHWKTGDCDPYVQWAEGPDAITAVQRLIRALISENGWEESVVEDLIVVEVIEGHHQGVLMNYTSFPASKVLNASAADLHSWQQRIKCGLSWN